MWNRNTWCEKIILLTSGILLFIFLFNIISRNVSFNIWFTLYTLLFVVSSVWITCYQIQFVLNRNEPLKINLENGFLCKLLKNSFIRKRIVKKLTLKPTIPHKKEEQDDEAIEFEKASTISSVIERKCVWSWYSQYVSKEIAFPFACKEFLDQIVVKSFQVFSLMHTVNFTSDLFTIVLRHLKEYKKSKKRLEKCNKNNIEECYRKFHPTSAQRSSNATTNKGKSTQNYCLNIVKALLKELLPWELWDTPHALLLASILSKRLDTFINNNLSDPVWLRYWIIQGLIKARNKSDEFVTEITPIINEETVQNIENEDQNVQIKEDTPVPSVIKTSIESALTNMISNSTAPILQRAEIEENAPKNVLQNIIPSYTATQPINITNMQKSYEFDTNNTKTKNMGDVKIYDRLLDGSVKTWNNDRDLECVSLGQDLLASLDREMDLGTRLGRLWEADSAESSEWNVNPPSSTSSIKSPHRLWFGEEDAQDMELTEESPPKNTVQTNTTTNSSNFSITKPLGIQNIKELQNISKNTVNQAKNKIGDLQDEAAGVMEGILDFGIAGLKKGLRLTGLQETLQDNSKEKNSITPATAVITNNKTSDNPASNLVAAIGQVLSSSRKNSQTDENDIQKITSTSIKKDETSQEKPNNSSQLVKQHRVISQDSEIVNVKNIQSDTSLPLSIDPVIIASDSPDYEYEEVEDFASTIAKLRCLLQQKTGDITPGSIEESSKTGDGQHFGKLTTTPLIQSNNSPVHQPNTQQNANYKLEEVPSISSVESENGFTILSQNMDDLVEAEDALNQRSFQTELPLQENNIQRLDKLFTRTVTGVFNSIKTAVGGDAVTEMLPGQTDVVGGSLDKQRILPPISKDSWVFTRKDVDASVLIGKLLVERRGYCIVEAAQDSLETLGGVQNYPTVVKDGEMSTSIIQDDLDETEIIDKCPLWHMSIEIIAVIMGGVIQKDVFVKCATITASETIENVLRDNLKLATSWIKTKIIDLFHDLHKDLEETSSNNLNRYPDVEIDKICNEILETFPALIFTIFGKSEITEALQTVLSSISHQLINRDLIFNILDVFLLHFLKANALRNNTCVTTPPPSA